MMTVLVIEAEIYKIIGQMVIRFEIHRIELFTPL